MKIPFKNLIFEILLPLKLATLPRTPWSNPFGLTSSKFYKLFELEYNKFTSWLFYWIFYFNHKKEIHVT